MRYTKKGLPRGSATTNRINPWDKSARKEVSKRKNSNDLSDRTKRPWTYEIQCLECKTKVVTGFIGKASCPRCKRKFKKKNGVYSG